MKYKYAKEIILGEKTFDDIPILYKKQVNALINDNMDELIAKCKEEKWEEIKKARNTQEQSGLPFKDSVLDYDLISVTRLTQARDGLKEAIDKNLLSESDASVVWTMQDNSTMVLSYDDLKSIPLIAINFSNYLHEKARELREQISAATTVEEIYSLKW